MTDVGTIEEFESLTGLQFGDPDLLRVALTHSSARGPETPCNERLEFLGDSVLGLVIAEELFRRFPAYTEGDLTLVKSEVVSSRALARAGRKMGFERFVTVGKGLDRQRGLPPSLVAGVMEALIGAIFLDRGTEAARAFILKSLGATIEHVLATRHRRNFKSLLQNLSQKRFGVTPLYRVVGETGPDHGKTFEVEALIGPRRFPVARGRSKKEAEQAAAEEAMSILAASRCRLPVPNRWSFFSLPWLADGVTVRIEASVFVEGGES